jgi:hypothetical protein
MIPEQIPLGISLPSRHKATRKAFVLEELVDLWLYKALREVTGRIAPTLIIFTLVVNFSYGIGIVARTVWGIWIKRLAGLNHRQFSRALRFVLNPASLGDGFFQHIVEHLVVQLGELRRGIFHLCMLDSA